MGGSIVEAGYMSRLNLPQSVTGVLARSRFKNWVTKDGNRKTACIFPPYPLDSRAVAGLPVPEAP